MATDYWRQKNVEEKQFVELENDDNFILDAISFLQGSRRNFSNEDIDKMSRRDIVDEIWARVRIQNTGVFNA